MNTYTQLDFTYSCFWKDSSAGPLTDVTQIRYCAIYLPFPITRRNLDVFLLNFKL